MAINTNNDGGLRALPEAPSFPSNIGKLDVGAIYDQVANGLSRSENIGQATRTGIAQAGDLQTQLATQAAQRSLIPSDVAAKAASNLGTVQQTPIQTGILSSTLRRQQGTEATDIAAKNASNTEQNLQSQLGQLYAKSGITYGAEQADQINQAKGRLLLRISNAPNGVVNEPILGPNGIPIGSMVGYVGANGPEFHAVPIPFGQMARINTGIQYQSLGTINDPQTGQPQYDQYQTVFPNAAGGITKGEVVKVAHGQPAPGDLYQGGVGGASGGASAPGAAGTPGTGTPAGSTTPGSSTLPGASDIGQQVPGGRLAAEFQQKQAEARAKQRTDALAGIAAQRDTLNNNSLAISKLTNDIQAEQQSPLGSGPITGGVLSALRPTARAVNADLSNFVSQVMESAKNIRTQREFNAYTGSIPTASDQAAVQNGKLQYLNEAHDILTQRNDYKEQLLRTDPKIDADQADQIAVSKFPFPTPPGGWTQHADGTPITPQTPTAPTVPAAPTQTSAPGQPAMITVRTADGQTGQIPAANLQAAIARGAVQVQ